MWMDAPLHSVGGALIVSVSARLDPSAARRRICRVTANSWPGDYSGFTVFAVAQSEPGFTRFECNASILS